MHVLAVIALAELEVIAGGLDLPATVLEIIHPGADASSTSASDP